MLADRLPYESRLRGLHPGVKAVWSLAMLAAVFAGGPVVQGVVLSVVFLQLLLLSGLSAVTFLGLLAPVLLFGLIGALVVHFSSGVGWWGALSLLARVSSASAVFAFLAANTPFVHLLWLMGRLGVPDLLVEVFELVYRYLFLLSQTVDAVKLAQDSRLGFSSFSCSLRSLSFAVGAMLRKVFLSLREASMALESRNFDGRFAFLARADFRAEPLLVAALMLPALGCLFLALLLPQG